MNRIISIICGIENMYIIGSCSKTMETKTRFRGWNLGQNISSTTLWWWLNMIRHIFVYCRQLRRIFVACGHSFCRWCIINIIISTARYLLFCNAFRSGNEKVFWVTLYIIVVSDFNAPLLDYRMVFFLLGDNVFDEA